MFALQFTEFGGPEVLSLGEAPEPHAGPGQIRIVVRAASVNPMDWKIRSGMLAEGRPLEGTAYQGFDAAGVVDEVGEGVTGVAVGDDVFGLGRNTHAEYRGSQFVGPQAGIAGLGSCGRAGTVAEAAERVLRLLGVTEGSTLFIDGGSGGVGATADPDRQGAGRHCDRISERGESGLPPRDRRDPRRLRRRHGGPGAGA